MINVTSLVLIVFGFLTVMVIWISLTRIVEEYIFVNKNKSYLDLFQHFCKVAYEQVYKDQILAFSSSGFRTDGEVLETANRNFVKLVYQLMGTRNIQYLTRFYGDSDNLTENILVWFKSQLDNDEVLDFVEKQRVAAGPDEMSTKLEELEKDEIGDE